MAGADDNVWYALIQWEDRFMSVIGVDKIVQPPKESLVPGNVEGQLVRAKNGPKVYEAVICELHRKWFVFCLSFFTRELFFSVVDQT